MRFSNRAAGIIIIHAASLMIFGQFYNQLTSPLIAVRCRDMSVHATQPKWFWCWVAIFPPACMGCLFWRLTR
jgi:hypothetical protein